MLNQDEKDFQNWIRDLWYTIYNKQNPLPLGELFAYTELDNKEIRRLFKEAKEIGIREYHRERKRKYRELEKVLRSIR